MAEHINKSDTLNEGRVKLNAAISDSNIAKDKATQADVKSTQALANSESTQTQLDTIVIEGDSSVEAAQARVDEKGVPHPTLKARIDDGLNSVNHQLADMATKEELYTRGLNVLSPPIPLNPVLDDGTDQTSNLNALIQYANLNRIENLLLFDGTYLVDPGSFNNAPDGASGGIQLLDNTKLILSVGATIKALPSEGRGYNIIRAWRKKNIAVIGGTIQGERNEHIGEEGEWGHGINIRGCENVVIETRVTDCWGDGVYLGAAGNAYPCKNVFIPKLHTKNNRRQGLSVTHLDGFHFGILNLEETNGADPQAGIDIEPNAHERVVNGFIDTLDVARNAGAGLQIYADRDGAIVDNIVINKVIAIENDYGFLSRKDKVKGVKINTLIASKNTRDGFRVAEGSSGVSVGQLVSKDNGGRGLSLSQASNIIIGSAELVGNITSSSIGGGSKDCTITYLDIKNADNTNYGLDIGASENIKVLKGTVDKAQISTLRMTGSNNSDINMEVHGSKSHPIILNNAKGNKITGVIAEQDLDNDNELALIRLENNSYGNSIINVDSSKLTGNRGRWAVQFVNSTGNFVGYNNFKDSYGQGMFDGASVNEIAYNYPIV